jgi:hypothetical protein
MCIPEGTRMFMAALFVIIAKYWKKKTKTSHTLSLNR